MKTTEADILWGADEIGPAIGRSRRQTFHLLERGHLPARKVGGRWVARRGDLLASLGAKGSDSTSEGTA